MPCCVARGGSCAAKKMRAMWCRTSTSSSSATPSSSKRGARSRRTCMPPRPTRASTACANGKNRTRLIEIRTAGHEHATSASAESRTLALEILQRLDDHEAQLAVYLYCDELTHDEIAELFGCSRRHVGDPRTPAAPPDHGACCMTHFSELSVDKYLAGELTGDAAALLRDHATSCARCGESLDSALATRDAFVFESPRLSTHRRWWRSAAIAAPLAAAAAFALVLAWPRSHEVVRTKGTAIVGFFVRARRCGPARRTDRHRDAGRSPAARDLGDRARLVRSGQRGSSRSPQRVRPRSSTSKPVTSGRCPMQSSSMVSSVERPSGVCSVPVCSSRSTLDLAAPPAGCTVDRFTLDKVAR